MTGTIHTFFLYDSLVAFSAKELQSSQNLGFYWYGVWPGGGIPYVAFHQAADIHDRVSRESHQLRPSLYKSANVNGVLLIFCRLAKNTQFNAM